MDILFNFSSNWANKTQSDYFTTISMSEHQIGEKGLITLKNSPLFIAEIIGKTKIKLDAESKGGILDFLSYQDTGYDWKETKKIIAKIYGLTESQMQSRFVYVYLVKKCKNETYQEATLL